MVDDKAYHIIYYNITLEPCLLQYGDVADSIAANIEPFFSKIRKLWYRYQKLAQMDFDC